MKQIGTSKNPEQILELLIQGIDKVQPFSLQELFSLASEAEKSGQVMNDKDVLLMLGCTGTGKSTTVHFLAGSKMRLVKINQISHIEPEEIYNQDLKNVVTSWKAKSETRYVTPVNIKLCFRNYIIADTPGSEDTQSAEIEYANIVGVQQAITSARSIRPLILFSFKNVGDRMQKLKELILYFGGLFNNLDDNVTSFTYIFTNVTEQTKGTIYQQLFNIRQNITIAEECNKDLIIMLNDMITKAEKGQIIEIDPLDINQREIILDQIIKNRPILYPGEVFRAKVSNQSHNKMQKQLSLHSQSIKNALNLKRGDLLNFKLCEIKTLIDLFPDNDQHKHVYNECLLYVQNFINSSFESAFVNLSPCFDVQAPLTEEELRKFLEQYNHAQCFDESISNSMIYSVPVKQSADYIAGLNQLILNIANELFTSQTKVCDKGWFDLIKKLNLIEKFEDLNIKTQPLINRYMLLVKSQSEYCKKLLQINEKQKFEMSSGGFFVLKRQENEFIYSRENSRKDQFQIMKNLTDEQSSMFETIIEECTNIESQFADDPLLSFQFEFSSYFSDIIKAQHKMIKINTDCSNQIARYIEEINNEFERFIKKMITESFEPFNDYIIPLMINQHHVETGLKTIECLDQFKFAFKDYKLVKTENIIEESINALQANLETVMTKNIEHIQDFLHKNQDKPQALQNMFDNLILLKSFSFLKNIKMETKFSSLTNSISQHLQSLEKSISSQLDNISGKIDFKNYNLLKKTMLTVSKLQWFQQYEEQIYQDTLESIEEKIKEKIDIIKRELKGKKFGVKDIENIKMLAQAENQVREYQELLSILNIQLKSSDGLELNLKLINFQQIIDTQKQNLSDLENVELPLEIYQLTQLEDFQNFLETLLENQAIFGSETDYHSILARIIGSQSSLIDKQYALIINKFQQIQAFIKDYCCTGNLSQSSEVEQSLDQLQTMLYTIADLKSNSPLLLSKIDPQSKLSMKVNQIILQILNSFNGLHTKLDVLSSEYHRSFDILSRLTYIDKFLDKQEFRTELERWRVTMSKNPAENMELFKQLFAIKNYTEINYQLFAAFLKNGNYKGLAHSFLHLYGYLHFRMRTIELRFTCSVNQLDAQKEPHK